MDYWAKAEAVKDSDKMVALLLYKKVYGGWGFSEGVKPCIILYVSLSTCVCRFDPIT